MKEITKTKNRFVTLILGILLWGLVACGIPAKNSNESLVISPAMLAEITPTDIQPAESLAVPTPTQIVCTIQTSNPIGKSISETYQVSYEQVMTWNCEGYPFEDILIALETSTAVDLSAATLLIMSLEKDWDTIWKEIGFTN